MDKIQISVEAFEELQGALQYRQFEQRLLERSWLWRARHWRQIVQTRRAFRQILAGHQVRNAMRGAGLDPDKTYTLDAQARTAELQ